MAGSGGEVDAMKDKRKTRLHARRVIAPKLELVDRNLSKDEIIQIANGMVAENNKLKLVAQSLRDRLTVRRVGKWRSKQTIKVLKIDKDALKLEAKSGNLYRGKKSFALTPSGGYTLAVMQGTTSAAASKIGICHRIDVSSQTVVSWQLKAAAGIVEIHRRFYSQGDVDLKARPAHGVLVRYRQDAIRGDGTNKKVFYDESLHTLAVRSEYCYCLLQNYLNNNFALCLF